MDTEVLRWFQQVADGATVTEVAELQIISQPAVSRALARLEDELGTPLLSKSGRVLRLTHAGAVFKRHADAVLHQLDDGLAAVSELLDPETGTVALAFQPSLGTWLVPALISDFSARHPSVRFRLEQSQDSLLSSPVTGGGIDLEFTARRLRGQEIDWKRLVTEPLWLAVPSDHRLAGRRQAALAEVAAEDFVMLHRGWELRARSEELCAAAGFTPSVTFEGDDLAMVRGFVAAGLGVSIVPAPPGAATRWAGRERLVEIADAGASRDVGLAWSRERHLLPAAQLFRQHVLEADLQTLFSARGGEEQAASAERS
ncbi:LysR substrate-binding domain-containing protein [Naasia sp. SYSU D00948]|uniref:LysR substrate-binding domain-containing protein n=1 Tax=Naasia sp. SYSU D00948 TaxID=2817379 RepID=UPI001B301C9E|nr:LysR substrate-binding domain-containing protein [Naasia sp. SYSU D00948]